MTRKSTWKLVVRAFLVGLGKRLLFFPENGVEGILETNGHVRGTEITVSPWLAGGIDNDSTHAGATKITVVVARG